MPDEKIYITRSHIIPEAITYLDGIYDIEVWQQNSPPPRELLLEKARECDALLTEVTDIVDAELLDQATNLKVVANRAVGLDNIDIPAATRNGILIGNTPGVLHESCADFTLGLILSLARNIAYGERRIRAGEWKVFDQIPYLGTDVHGATHWNNRNGADRHCGGAQGAGIRYANRLFLPHAQARCRGRAWRGVARRHGLSAVRSRLCQPAHAAYSLKRST